MSTNSSIIHFFDRLKLYVAGGSPEPSQIDHHELKLKYYISDFTNRATANFLIRYFNGTIGHEVDPNRGFIGFGLLHYSFIALQRPNRVLCIGSQKGFIPAICAMACKDNNFGTVDFIDAGKEKSNINSWGGIGFWKRHDPTKHFSPYDLNRFITTYVMTSQEFAEKYTRRRYGYIYIDGDHSFAGVSRDYSIFWPTLEKGGIMCFHDITLKGKAGSGEYGVWKLWKELSEKNKISILVRENGVGFIQKVE